MVNPATKAARRTLTAEVREAFRYYRTRYNHWRPFDRALRLGQCQALKGLAFSVGRLRWFARWVDRGLPGGASDPPRPQVVAIAFSRNQGLVAQLVADLGLIDRVVLVGVNTLENRSSMVWLPERRIALSAVAAGNALLRTLKEAESDYILRRNSARVAKAVGIRRILPALGISTHDVVVLLNDHEPYSTLTFDWARAQGNATVYIQHAPVNHLFPPLHHDLNVLFSPQSVDAYERAGKATGTVLPFFDLRMLPGLSVPPPPTPSAVLVCSNPLDRTDRVEATLRSLANSASVLHRPHPRDHRKWPPIKGVRFSRGRRIWDDLAECRAVIGNETAVVLEALVTRRPYFKASHWSNRLDNYGFLSRGLLQQEYESDEEILSALQSDRRPFQLSELEHFVGPVSSPEQRSERVEALRRELDNLLGRQGA